MWFLGLGTGSIDEQHAILFGGVLKAGALPHLLKLEIGGQRVYEGLWEALQAGSWPGIRESLNCGVCTMFLTVNSASALVQLWPQDH